jgi:hypothetical protein
VPRPALHLGYFVIHGRSADVLAAIAPNTTNLATTLPLLCQHLPRFVLSVHLHSAAAIP